MKGSPVAVGGSSSERGWGIWRIKYKRALVGNVGCRRM